MGSRRRNLGGGRQVHTTLGRTSLGDALDQCEVLCRREAHHRVEFTHSSEWVRSGLFAPEILNLARQCRGIMDGDASSYVDYGIGNNVDVRLWWNDTNMVAVSPRHLLPNVNGQSCWELYEHSPLQHLVPLMKARDKLQEIVTKWQRARAVIRAMDEKATLGAFRYYLPGIIQLCKSDVPAEMSSRFNEPLWIGPWISLIREAQETIATSALLPQNDPAPRAKPLVFLTRSHTEHPVSTAIDVTVDHDAWTFKI